MEHYYKPENIDPLVGIVSDKTVQDYKASIKQIRDAKATYEERAAALNDAIREFNAQMDKNDALVNYVIVPEALRGVEECKRIDRLKRVRLVAQFMNPLKTWDEPDTKSRCIHSAEKSKSANRGDPTELSVWLLDDKGCVHEWDRMDTRRPNYTNLPGWYAFRTTSRVLATRFEPYNAALTHHPKVELPF
jgi:hypothetical protein